MSPFSLLHTPVDLLREAPRPHESAPHGEGKERRVVSWWIGIAMALGALLIGLS